MDFSWPFVGREDVVFKVLLVGVAKLVGSIWNSQICWWLNIFDLHRYCRFGVFLLQPDVARPKNLAPDVAWLLKKKNYLTSSVGIPFTRVQHSGFSMLATQDSYTWKSTYLFKAMIYRVECWFRRSYELTVDCKWSQLPNQLGGGLFMPSLTMKNQFFWGGASYFGGLSSCPGMFFLFTWLFSAFQRVIFAHGLRWHDDHGLLWHMVSCSCCDTVSVYNWDVTLEVEPVPPLTRNCLESVYMCQSRSPRGFLLDTCSPGQHEESIPPISHSTGIADLHIEIDILNELSPKTSCIFSYFISLNPCQMVFQMF